MSKICLTWKQVGKYTALLIVGAALSLVGYGGAGDGGAQGAITTQVWRFDGLRPDGTIAVSARATIQNGASTSPEDACCWRSNFGGCFVDTRFAVQFSGNTVRLLLFRIDSTSTCAGVKIAQAFGTGDANSSFPTATTAEGTSTLIFTTPLGQAGGVGQWAANRIR